LSVTDKEEKEWNKTVGSWNNHYIEDNKNYVLFRPEIRVDFMELQCRPRHRILSVYHVNNIIS